MLINEADASEGVRHPEPLAGLAMDREGFLLRFERGLEVALRSIGDANIAEGIGHALPIADFAVDCEGFLLCFERGL